MSIPQKIRDLDSRVQQITAVPQTIYGYRMRNPNSYTVYVKFYNKLAVNVNATVLPDLSVSIAAKSEVSSSVTTAYGTALSMRCTVLPDKSDTSEPGIVPEIELQVSADSGGSIDLTGDVVSTAGVSTLNPTAISNKTTDTSPTQDDTILTLDGTLSELRQVSLADFAGHITITSITDASSGFTAQFDTSALTANRTISIPNSNSGTVGVSTRGAGQIATGTNAGGVLQYGYRDTATLAQLTANQNDYTPATAAYYLRMSSDASRNVTGFVGSGAGGETHVIVNVGSFNIVLTHEDASSTAANRFHNSTSADITLTPNQEALVHYDSTGTRWRVTPIASGTSAGGSTTQIQYNNSGAFGGVSVTTYNGTVLSQQAGTSYLLTDPGDSAKKFRFDASNITTGNTRVFRIADASSVSVIADSGASNNFLTGITSAGAITKAQPALSDLSAFSSANLRSALSDENGTGVALFDNATSPTFITPVLGTPTSGTLTNCTALPVAGITASTSTALGVGSVELGHASDTTIARSGAGAVTVEGVQVILSGAALGTPASGTLTNCTIPDSATFTHDLTAIPNATGGWVEYFVTGSDFTTTNLTATAITGLTSGTLSNAVWYEFEVVLRMLNAADANGMKWGITGNGTGTASQVFCSYVVNSTGTAAAAAAAMNGVATLSSAFMAYSGGEGILTGKGFFLSRSTGTATMEIDVAKVTGNTATVRVASVLRIRKAHT